MKQVPDGCYERALRFLRLFPLQTWVPMPELVQASRTYHIGDVIGRMRLEGFCVLVRVAQAKRENGERFTKSWYAVVHVPPGHRPFRRRASKPRQSA